MSCRFRDKVLTGSFDKTAKLWSSESGKCFHTFRGHSSEIVCLNFDPRVPRWPQEVWILVPRSGTWRQEWSSVLSLATLRKLSPCHSTLPARISSPVVLTTQ
ncbi:DAW1 [Bugula neritina]|uniref:DAW1 n=1 Tax=Bugula neritina TaxID=10212 RepID=A0A7J7JP20_BUGNE|nr:DAW1 [Bugula neritina]